MPVGRGYKPIKPGTALTADKLNRTLGQGVARSVQVSGPVSGRRFPDSVAFDIKREGNYTGHSVIHRWAVVDDVFEDYLQCSFYDIATGLDRGNTVYVAKPFHLQQTPWDGVTVTYIDGEEITYTKDATNPEYLRNHDNGTDSADFAVTPNWFIGEPIVIVRLPSDIVVSGIPLSWMEFLPWRYWARVE